MRKIRLNCGLTQVELARLANVTPQCVLRTEQYLYSRPSPRIVAALSRHPECALSEDQIERIYAADRHQVRHSARNRLKLNHWPALELNYPNPSSQPAVGAVPVFVAWRTALFGSRIAFCKALAVHPAMLQKWESTTPPPESMPDWLIAVFQDSPMRASSLKRLVAACAASVATDAGAVELNAAG